MLRAYVDFNQKDWDKLLTAAEIAVNNSQQSSTQQTPFMLNYGQHPYLPLDVAISSSDNCTNPAAIDRLQQLHNNIELAKKNLLSAQQRQSYYADQHRREVTFNIGDQVLLSTANLKLKVSEQTPKLLSKFIGPFSIVQVISPVAYKLDLPYSLSSIHPVVHVSKLKLYNNGISSFPHRSPPPIRPPPLIIPDTNEIEYEVERIVDKRERRYGRGKRIEYLVLWKGYPDYEKTWEPEHNLKNAQEIIKQFHTQQQQQHQQQQ